MSIQINVGQNFGHWTVLEKDNVNSSMKHPRWICKCDCGVTKSVLAQNLKSGESRSCGCHSHENLKGINATHGMSKTRIYREWASLRKRCRQNSPDRKLYFDKGVKVCEEWECSFENFRDWAMANGYSDTLTIDRIDVNGNYCPDNCRWISNAEQQANRTNTVYVEYEGKKWCLRTLCVTIGFPYKLAHRRYRKMIKRSQPISIENIFAPKRSAMAR